MTPKQTEKLHKDCIKFGMDFDAEYFSQEDDLKFIIRWAKKEKGERSIVRQKLKESGCHSIEHLQMKSTNIYTL